MTSFDPRILVRVPAAAALISTPRRLLDGLVKRGEIDARRLPNGEVVIPMEAIREFARALPTVHAPPVPTC